THSQLCPYTTLFRSVIEAKIGYLQSMLGEGFDIEYSEIIRSHRQVKDALFLSYKYMMVLNFKGLTEAWLTVKQEDAHLEYKRFRSEEHTSELQSREN